LGNEIYYCIQCGIRVSGAQIGEGWDRSRCARCQGIEIRKDFPPVSQASTRIRRVSSSSSIPLKKPPSGTLATVTTKPRSTDLRPRKTSQIALLAGVSVAVVAVAVVFALPGIPAPVEPRQAPAPVVVAPVLLPVAPALAAPTPPPPPDSLRTEFLKQLDALKEQSEAASDPEQADELLTLFADALQVAPRLAPERRGEILDWQKAFRTRYEAMADALYDPISEAATALASEGRPADAIAHLRTFPKGLRRSRAWTRLEALERQIQGSK
jgi:hypothetical protein